MNFFEHQAKARARSRWLVMMFLIAVAAVVAAIDFVVVVALGYAAAEDGGDAAAVSQALPAVVLWTSVAVLAVIVLSSLYKTARLRSGGGAVARTLGGTLVPAGAGDPKCRRLRNVVEEIAIASGVPVPEIYVLEKEAGINAFAAGYTPADAAVAVTRGTLDKLSRDELQGVIAHEYSHILNGDMRLNIRLMGMIFGLLVLHVIGREVLDAMRRGRGGGGKKDGAGAVALVALGLLIVGGIGVFFGRLIKAGVSRSREFLADASAVQFTRQASGIAGALKKIGGLTAGSRITEARAHAEEVSHMLFGDGIGYSALFATHPSLIERIRRIEPQFDARELKARAAEWNDPAYVPPDPAPAAPAAGFAAAGAAALSPAQVVASAGHPAPEDYRYAEALHAALAPQLLEAARDPQRAEGLALAMLLDTAAGLRARQLQAIESALGAPAHDSAQAASRHLAGLAPAQRLPLLEIAFPALKQRPRDRLIALLATVSRLIHADGSVAAFEYCLGRLLRTYVADTLAPARARPSGRRRLPECRAAIEVLLGTLARHGHERPEAARRAYAAGIGALLPDAAPPQAPGADWPSRLDDALQELDALRPPAKQLLVEAMVRTVGHDRRVTVGETELLRVVCAALHCPLPPLLAAGAAA